MFKYYISILIFIFCINFFTAQNINPIQLGNEISKLNCNKEYQTSIKRLEEIINSSKYTNYDKYIAYLNKSYTHKRLFNYSQALDNLILAYEIGITTDKKEEVESKIKIERLFILYDLQKNNEVIELLPQVTPSDLKRVDLPTRAFFNSILATTNISKGNLINAEKQLDESINLLKRSSPRDLPNIYRKKVALYGKTKNDTKALESYRLGLYYAKKYNMDLYVIFMNEAIGDYYLELGNYKEALFYQKKVSDLRGAYNHVNHAGDLNILEKKLLQNRKNTIIEYERKFRYAMNAICCILLVLVYVMFKLYKSNKDKRNLMEKENSFMRSQLENLSKELDEKGVETLNISNYNLSTRQLEIIKLVKEGKTNKEIGNQLNISENTVKYHLKSIYNILDIENRVQLKLTTKGEYS